MDDRENHFGERADMNLPREREFAGREGIRWEFHKGREFERFMAEWDEVNRAASGLPLLSATFVALLLKEFGTGRELLAIGYRGDTINAMSVLERKHSSLYTTFQPAQAPLGIWIHRPPDTLETLASSLLRDLPGLALALGVSQQDPDWATRPGESATTRTLDYIQTARVTVAAPFDAYWAARGKNLRNNTKRQRSRLEKDGVALRLETIVDPAGVAQAIVDYGHLESSGWKGAEGTAIHPDNAQGRFYRALLEDFCRRGAGRIFRYWYGNAVAAVDLCIEGNGTLIVLKTTYDETIKTSSPASLMRHEYFEKTFAEGKTKRIEFYGRVMDWHTKWTDEVRTLYHINHYRWPIVPQLRRLLRRQRNSSTQTSSKDGFEDDKNTAVQAVAAEWPNVVKVYDDLSALPVHYESLFSRAGSSSLFFTLPWYKNYVLSVMGPEARLRAYTVETGATDARTALLMQHGVKGGGAFTPRALNSLGNYYTSLFGPILDPAEGNVQGALDAIAAKIADDDFRWDTVDLHPLALNPPVFPALVAAFRRAGFLVHTYFCFGNWYLQVNGRTYSEYFEMLSSRVRNTIRKKKDQMKESGSSTTRIYTDPDSLDEAMEAYEKVYAASWKRAEPYPAFIRGLCRTCALQGWLRLGIIYINNQPAAAQIWIVHADVATIYKLAHDEQFAMFSPGTLLTAHLMEYVIDVDKVREVDYLTGDDAYKKGWMSDRRERWGIVAFNPHTPLGLIALSLHLIGRAKQKTIEFAGQLRPAAHRTQ